MPWRMSRNCRTATSQPNSPREIVRAPKSGVPNGPSARRMRTSARPVTFSPCVRWNARIPATVRGPTIASMGPSYSPCARRATCSPACCGFSALAVMGAARPAASAPASASRKRMDCLITPRKSEVLLARRKARRGLLDEGGEALLRDRAVAQLAELARLGVERIRHHVHEALRERERAGALRRQRVRNLERTVEHRIGDLVDQPDAQCLLRVNGAPRVDQVLRDADTAHAREPLCATPPRHDREIDLRL